ncbi:MAG: hypothetical protein NC204_05985 [Candidatus Amulumruptor caecigallinarius]|nr:hypothetical protein [Candidatus Amulumruptor caecigallinarius]
MRARDAISHIEGNKNPGCVATVGAGMSLLDVLPVLLETPDGYVGVTDGDECLGRITKPSMLEALAKMIPERQDCSVLEIYCAPTDYSASHIARAVEDVDVHLVDLLTAPARDGKISVTLRVRCDDPAPVVLSLERYGYTAEIVSAHSVEPSVSYERLLAVRTLIDL